MIETMCYHGTTEKAADRIQKDGFNPDTWFARHMEDALEFGGSTVLQVEFEKGKLPRGWQFHVLESYPASKIVKRFQIKVAPKNKEEK